MPKNKVVLQVARLYTPHIGGVETHVAAVNKELQARNYTVKVITTQDTAAVPLDETIDGVEVFRIPGKDESKVKVWRWIWQHRFLFWKADIVQVHDVFWWLWPVYFLVAPKLFITFHGWEGQFPVSWKAKLQRWIASKLSKGRLHIGDWIKEFYWDTPDEVIYGGVNQVAKPEFKKSALEKIVFLGRLTAENEVSKYIEIFTQLKSHLPDLKITWVGDGPLAAKCKAVGEVTGKVINPEQIVKSADVVFAASYLSMLQAQALGKVVVAVYTHSLKQRYLETYPGATHLLMGENPQELAQKIEETWKSAKYLELQKSAWNWASQMTWKKVTTTYEKLWQKKSQ